MRLRLICLIHGLLAAFSAHAQRSDRQLDSLTRKLKADSAHIYRNTLAKPFLRVENRNSFIIREPVDFYGGLAGVTFLNRHTIAAGYYFLDNRSKREIRLRHDPSISQQIIRFSHFSFVYQMALVNIRHFQLNVPLEIGAGSYYASMRDESAPGVNHYSGIVVPLVGGVQLIGKVYRWLGVSASGGYRYVRNKDVLVRFNGLYYSFGVWVDARQVYRDHRFRRAKKKYRHAHAALSAQP